MSLKINTLKPTATGPVGAQTEQRPRFLHQPDSYPDADEKAHHEKHNSDATQSLHASSSLQKPFARHHGNGKPQETAHHRKWVLPKCPPNVNPTDKYGGKQVMVQHPHAQTWSSSSCPGKRQSLEGTNTFHRVWMQECSPDRPRWNRERKKEFYDKQEKELYAKKPHDDQFNTSESNYKFWTHLQEGGVKAGGQEEKLDYTYRGPNTGTTHFYKGKYDNVRHVQRIVKTGWKDPKTEKKRELHADTRPMFDNRLNDDVVAWREKQDKQDRNVGWDLFRPANTMSCPQLGADHCKH